MISLKCSLCIDCLVFNPVRTSVQGEMIRNLDTNHSQNNRRNGHGDNDDDSSSTMNVYQQRQQKRIKIMTSND